MQVLHRFRGWKVVAPVLLLIAVVLGLAAVSCSPDGERTPAAARIGPSLADIEDLADPRVTGAVRPDRPTTTSAVGSNTVDPSDGGAIDPDSRETEPEGSDGADLSVPRAGADDCASLSEVVIPAAAIITAADFVPPDQRPSGGDATLLDAVSRVIEVVPADQRSAWQHAQELMGRAASEQRALTIDERSVVQDARNGSEVWARSACPAAPPSWQCDHFGSAGSGPDVAPSKAEASTPAAVLRRYADTGRAVELDRTDDAVLYGWVTGLGFVTRTHQAERVSGGWATARVHVCHGTP